MLSDTLLYNRSFRTVAPFFLGLALSENGIVIVAFLPRIE